MGPITGKQIAVAMTVQDERKFLAFLRTTADVQILAVNSPRADRVWLDTFPGRDKNNLLNTRFLLWNRAFSWEPQIHALGDSVGVVNGHQGPVIDYRRHPLAPWAQVSGRLYWSRGMTPDGPYRDKSGRVYSYDAEAFDRWWKEVVRWVKAHSHHRRDKWTHVHYLPWAWWRYGKWRLG